MNEQTNLNADNLITTKYKIEPWKILACMMTLCDFVIIHLSYFLALWVRFDCSYKTIPDHYLTSYLHTITIYAIAAVIFFWLMKMYRTMWEFASYVVLIRTLFGSVISSVLYSVLISILIDRMPVSYHLWGGILQLVMLIAARFSYRLLLFFKNGLRNRKVITGHVMIIGAGSAGQLLLRDLKSSKEITDKAECFIDDDPNKWGRNIEGVPVVGGRDDIMMNVEKYHINKIYLAIPSASVTAKRDILSICNETGCQVKQLPGMYQLVLGQVSVNAMQDIRIEDLLGREPIKTDMEDVYNFINNKVVMVTGGGGSIGSELCRQIAAHDPKQLIIFDIYENNAYAIQLELREKYPELSLVVLIGSVRDSRRMYDVFETYRPEIVYHAAAHKHVPLMEDSPNEAIKNNAIGTYKTAYAAMVHGCKRFVLISTDKAVNPTNVMGASKRICEMIIQSFDEKVKAGKAAEIPQLFTHEGFENADRDGSGTIFENITTEFVAVRFGNVLGSNGSVIPVFRNQIANGGPVTVTHPDIIRYFMTISEAVSLVMLAGTFAHGGEIFVLDMGSPVKIDTLARNMIRLSGFKPDVDIKIEYVGLRPGEKLYEEMLMAEEGLQDTENSLIHIGRPIPFDTNQFLCSLDKLMKVAYSNKSDIRDYIKDIVNTYQRN